MTEIMDPPRPKHFLKRPDGTFTALIEVDQLPPSIRMVGIPKTIGFSETLNMRSLGVQSRHPNKYVVEFLADSQLSPPAKTVSRSPNSVWPYFSPKTLFKTRSQEPMETDGQVSFTFLSQMSFIHQLTIFEGFLTGIQPSRQKQHSKCFFILYSISSIP